MPEINSTESLMVWIMNRLSEVYDNHAILKGGMVLRLLDCPRYTNDIDYVFVPYKSKKDIVDLIEKVLMELEGAKISHNLHSTSLRFIIDYQGFKTQIEANVALNCKTQPMSTTALAKPNNQLPRIINVMGFDWALAHKLAAWNERELMRDLYDIYFIHAILDVMPDLDILNTRLEKINYLKRTKAKNLPTKMSLAEFTDRLKRAIETLTPEDVQTELRDYFDQTELVGLDKKMKVGIKSLIEKLQANGYGQ